MRQKDKNKIKKLLIDSMAFLKVGAYAGISDSIEKIGDIIDEDSYNTVHDRDNEDEEDDYEEDNRDWEDDEDFVEDED